MMFWSGNFIFVRELNFLLKEENVSLKQVLEADDILQECKADNKALIQFLTKPEILTELITLITEEPPKDVELTAQYRHASVACEVLTSHLSMLSDRLSLDTAQMHRLCDFINREPPLNPLLASYFSKTIEMLLERSPKQDWYLHHIVCLRVLDFLHARRDFLPNLLRHVHTSAIADTIKCFVRVDDLFNKLIMEWVEEHQLLENLINIVCGTYTPPPVEPPPVEPPPVEPTPCPAPAAAPEPCVVQAVQDIIHKVMQIQLNHVDGGDGSASSSDWENPTESLVKEADQSDAPPTNTEITSEPTPHRESNVPTQPDTNEKNPDQSAKEARTYANVTRNAGGRGCVQGSERSVPGGEGSVQRGEGSVQGGEGSVQGSEGEARRAAVAASNAAALLCDLINNGCAVDVCANRSLTSWALVARLQSERLVRQLLRGVFTCPARARPAALRHGARLLLALLTAPPVNHPALNPAGGSTPGDSEPRSCVEQCLAPHLPLLHHALLQPTPAPAPAAAPAPAQHQRTDGETGSAQGNAGAGGGAGGGAPRVGAARVQVAALLAHLALSDVAEVTNTMITLGTPGMLVDMFFQYPNNSFLHAEVLTLVRHALSNGNAAFRLQYAAHLIKECDLLTRLMDIYEEEEAKKQTGGTRSAYMGHVILMLRHLAQALDPDSSELLAQLELSPALVERWRAFLGGYYPPDNIYEDENMAPNMDATYDFNELPADELARCALPPRDPAPEDGEACARDSLEDEDDEDKMEDAKRSFLDLASQRFGDDMWEDSPCADDEEEGLPEGVFGAPGVHRVLDDVSPWESGSSSTFEASEMANAFDADSGWAQFGQVCAPPVDPFAPLDNPSPAPGGGPSQPPAKLFEDETFDDPTKLRLETTNSDLSHDASAELANNLLTAMSAMAPDVIANIVNANLAPPGETLAPHSESLTPHSESLAPHSESLVPHSESLTPHSDSPAPHNSPGEGAPPDREES